jgi:hypothetical protein
MSDYIVDGRQFRKERKMKHAETGGSDRQRNTIATAV